MSLAFFLPKFQRLLLWLTLTLPQVLAIVPEDNRIKLLVENSSDDEIQSWIQRLIVASQSDSSEDTLSSQNTTLELEKLCSAYFESLPPKIKSLQRESWMTPFNTAEALTVLIKAVLTLRNQALFDRTVAFSPWSLPQASYFEIGSAMNSLTLAWCRDGYHPLLSVTLTPTNTVHSLQQALRQIQTFHQCHEILQTIRAGNDSQGANKHDEEKVELWIRAELKFFLAKIKVLSQEDAPIMVALGSKYGPEFFLSRYTQSSMVPISRH